MLMMRGGNGSSENQFQPPTLFFPSSTSLYTDQTNQLTYNQDG
jgi:hypothetical protein